MATTVTISIISGLNITLVYDSIDLRSVNRNKLQSVFPEIAPAVMDTPDVIVATYHPAIPLVVQIERHRLQVSVVQEFSPDNWIDGLEHFPLWQYIHDFSDILPVTSSLIAYGYNFDLVLHTSEGQSSQVLNTAFVGNPQDLEDLLQGTLIHFSPRIVFSKDSIKYDIRFEPLSEDQIRIHINAHFEHPHISIPGPDDVRATYLSNVEYAVDLIQRLLNR